MILRLLFTIIHLALTLGVSNDIRGIFDEFISNEEATAIKSLILLHQSNLKKSHSGIFSLGLNDLAQV